MNFESIEQLIKSNTSLKLIRAENVPLIIGFLYQTFKSNNAIEIKEKNLIFQLEMYLNSLNRSDTKKYSKEGKDYLIDWTNSGFLRRDFDTSDEPIYELTPSTENVFKWMEELEKPEFIGADSRLKLLFDKMKELSMKTKIDSAVRIAELELEKKRIEQEIENIQKGKLDTLDERQIKEHYYLIEETARRLLYDFRQVEQNFRDLDRNFRTKVITSSLTKGEVLAELFEQQDHLKETDQGKSFHAFWEFLLSLSKQKEFENLVDDILNIPVIQKIRIEKNKVMVFPIENTKNNLIEAGDKINRTNGSLISQLRRYLDQRSFFENKRIHDNIREILKIISNQKENNEQKNFPMMEMDDTIKIDLILERPLFRPPTEIKFTKMEHDIGKSTSDNKVLFEQFEISISELKAKIKNILKENMQISFLDFIKIHPIKKGIAEIIGYIEIAEKENHICDSLNPEFIIVSNQKTNKFFRVKIPHIIFCRK